MMWVGCDGGEGGTGRLLELALETGTGAAPYCTVSQRAALWCVTIHWQPVAGGATWWVPSHARDVSQACKG